MKILLSMETAWSPWSPAGRAAEETSDQVNPRSPDTSVEARRPRPILYPPVTRRLYFPLLSLNLLHA